MLFSSVNDVQIIESGAYKVAQGSMYRRFKHLENMEEAKKRETGLKMVKLGIDQHIIR